MFSRCVPVLGARDVHAEIHVFYMLYNLIRSSQGVPKVCPSSIDMYNNDVGKKSAINL